MKCCYFRCYRGSNHSCSVIDLRIWIDTANIALYMIIVCYYLFLQFLYISTNRMYLDIVILLKRQGVCVLCFLLIKQGQLSPNIASICSIKFSLTCAINFTEWLKSNRKITLWHPFLKNSLHFCYNKLSTYEQAQVYP